MKLFDRLREGLTRTRDGLSTRLGSLFRPGEARRLAEILDDLEEILIQADVGAGVAADLVSRVRKSAGGDRSISGVADLKRLLAQAIEAMQSSAPAAPAVTDPPAGQPRVVFLIGVNGGGKTTTAAKLAARALSEGRRAILAAADTFRAAAIDQLAVWADRVGVEMVRHREGADPSAVVFDALQAARARGIHLVVVDTAGRLHTKTPL